MRTTIFSAIIAFCAVTTVHAQQPDFYQPQSTNFWSDVRFGGGLGLGFGSGQTSIGIAPSAIKPITEEFYLGAGIQFNYYKSKNYFESTSYGASILGLYNPIYFLQFSAELEQLRVNNTIYPYYSNTNNNIKDNFWNTALFLGLGYTGGNVTVGVRYNLLHKNNNFVYSDAWMPFVRVYF